MSSRLRGILDRLADRYGIYIYRRSTPFGTHLRVDLKQSYHLTAPKVLFDVGANHGQTALEYAKWYPQARIHSFEPVAATAAVLRKNVAHLPQVEVHQIAFGAAAGSAAITANPCDQMTSLLPELRPTQGTGPEEVVTIETLDDFTKRKAIGRIDLLKIDTEGFDLEVLKGATSLLRAGAIDCILVEFGEFGHQPRHLPLGDHERFLRPFSYRLCGIYDQAPFYYANALFRRH